MRKFFKKRVVSFAISAIISNELYKEVRHFQAVLVSCEVVDSKYLSLAIDLMTKARRSHLYVTVMLLDTYEVSSDGR